MAKHRKPPPDRQGVTSLVLGAILFGIVGLVLIVFPLSFASPGGYGNHGQQLVTTVYSVDQARWVGGLFLCISGFLARGAWRIAKDR